jgi:hypothetical protein
MTIGLALGITAASHFTVTAVAEVIRKKTSVIAFNGAQIDTAQIKIGRGSALFDGTDDYLLVPHMTSLDFGTGPFTIEAWLYMVSYVTNSTIWGANVAQAAGNYQFSVTNFSPNTQRLVFVDGPSLNYVESTNQVPTGQWVHVAVSREGTGTNQTRVFIDGVLEGSGTVSTNYTFTDGFCIGRNRGGTAYLNGYIDELRVSNVARYTTTFTPQTTPFVNDENTLVLLHMDGTDGATDFPDDVGVRQANGVDMQGGAFLDTTDFKFGGGSFNGESGSTATVGKSSYDIAFGTGDFTLEAWVYITADFSSTGTVIFATGTSISDASDIRLGVGSTTNNFSVRLGTTNYLNASTIWSLNTWYHVALTRSSGICNLWVNGTKDTTVGSSGDMSFSQDCAARQVGIGRITYANVRCMPGNIDEVRISSVARYTSNFTAPTAAFINDEDTLMLLHFDEASAGSIDFYAYDDVGVRSKKAVTAIADAQIDTAQSKFGGASALFDGTDDALSIDNASGIFDFGTSDFTIEFWFRATALSGDPHLLDMRASAAYSSVAPVLYYRSASPSGLRWYINGSPIFSVGISTATWYHVAVSRSSGTIRMFLDGTQVGSDTADTNNYICVDDWWIGGQRAALGVSGLNSWDGHIDEVRISNTARYTTGFTPPTAPFQNDSNTLLLLHMDGTDGRTLFIDDNGVPPDYEY